MILPVQQRIHDAIALAVRGRLGVHDVPSFGVETPPSRALGDLSVTVAFQLARTLRRPPRSIAQDLAAEVAAISGVSRVVAMPNGYVNLFLDRRTFLLERTRGETSAAVVETAKTIVEHTAINPNKAAHVGHLRNAVLGDTLARVLRFRGAAVEVQNYIDDTGVQVADVVVGFQHLEGRTVEDVRRLADSGRFDYYCWDLYSRVTEWYEGDEARQQFRATVLHALEQGGNTTADMGALIVDRIVRAHLSTMARLGIAYDLLTYEGDILRLKFWAHAFEILKAQGAVFLRTEGELAGCWVMRIDDTREDSGAHDFAPAPSGEPASKHDAREKVIVRSNGVVTYIGKDIANQLWKFGLLGRDFRYRKFARQANGQILWATTSGDGDPEAPPFGRAGRTYNVIDSRQAYLQALLSQALRTLGHPSEAERSIHFSYEMVALSHATARELGARAAEEAEEGKPFIEVSGRRGLGVKIDDLLDLLTAKACAEVTKRNPDFSADHARATAAQIAVGAIRYFMLKFSRGKLIVFDMEEALSFEGETGPYLQYAVVRATNILHKLREREGLSEADLAESLASASADELAGVPGETDADDLWRLVFEAARLDDIVEQTVRALEFSILAKYAFGLARVFNGFYHKYPVLGEEDADRKRWRAAGVAYFRRQLTRALDLMGIEVPSRM
jgi:arginyl-tRNA synthetase